MNLLRRYRVLYRSLYLHFQRAQYTRLATVLLERLQRQYPSFIKTICLNFHGVSQTFRVEIRNNAARHVAQSSSGIFAFGNKTPPTAPAVQVSINSSISYHRSKVILLLFVPIQNRQLLIFTAVALVASMFFTATAQKPTPTQPNPAVKPSDPSKTRGSVTPEDQEPIRISTEEVQLSVADFDNYGRLDPSLQREDVMLVEDGE